MRKPASIDLQGNSLPNLEVCLAAFEGTFPFDAVSNPDLRLHYVPCWFCPAPATKTAANFLLEKNLRIPKPAPRSLITARPKNVMALPACFVAALPLLILSYLYLRPTSVRAKGASSIPQIIPLFAASLALSLYLLVTYSTAELSIQLTNFLSRLPSSLSS